MKLSEVKAQLNGLESISFILPNGSFVPKHFHITEVGMITKDFIDCGGTRRQESVINFQLWEDENDYNHRLEPQKLIDIIHLSEDVLGLEDLAIEVEYQGDTIGKYGLEFDGNSFLLTSKKTNCLALDKCGIPAAKPKIKLSDLSNEAPVCTPESGCC